jgi:hypothetical protein
MKDIKNAIIRFPARELLKTLCFVIFSLSSDRNFATVNGKAEATNNDNMLIKDIATPRIPYWSGGNNQPIAILNE